MVMCFAPTCKHYSESHSCVFFAFPKDEILLKKWIKLIRRKDRDPAKYSRICSCHFVNGDKNNGPTIFDYNVAKQFESTEPESKIKRKKVVAAAESEAGPSGLQSRIVAAESEAGSSDLQYRTSEGAAALQTTPAESSVEAETQEGPQKFPAMLEAENYFLKQELESLKNDLENLSVSFSFRHIENKPHLVSVYTGLPTKEIFLALFSLFENIELNYFAGWQVVRVSKMDQLLLTLMKLKLNLLNDDLASRFNISRETVSTDKKNVIKKCSHTTDKNLQYSEYGASHFNTTCICGLSGLCGINKFTVSLNKGG